MLLEGLHIPLTTPFHANGRVNLPKLAANVGRYSKTPASGMIVLGPSAETSLLSDDETREVLRAVAESATPEKVLLAGTARASVRSVLELAGFAATERYDAILVAAPCVLDPSQARELLVFFQTIADRSVLPVVLLNTVARRLPADVVAKLAFHPNILGMVDHASTAAEIGELRQTTGEIKHEATVTSVFSAVTERMLRAASVRHEPALISPATLTGGTVAAVADAPAVPALKTRTKTVGFQLIAGAPGGLLDSLNHGASAIGPAFAACAPQACYEVFAAWKDSDQPLAAEKQMRVDAAARFAEDVLGPGGLKFGCDVNGYFGGLPRLPYLPPTAEQRHTLQDLMQAMRT